MHPPVHRSLGALPMFGALEAHVPESLVKAIDSMSVRRLARITDTMLLADLLHAVGHKPKQRRIERWGQVVLDLHVDAAVEECHPVAAPTHRLLNLASHPTIDRVHGLPLQLSMVVAMFREVIMCV